MGAKGPIILRYIDDRKQDVLSKLQPQLNLGVAQVSRDKGIGLQTLCNWRNKALNTS